MGMIELALLLMMLLLLLHGLLLLLWMLLMLMLLMWLLLLLLLLSPNQSLSSEGDVLPGSLLNVIVRLQFLLQLGIRGGMSCVANNKYIDKYR